MKDKQTMAIQNSKISALLVLSLIFPSYSISFSNDNKLVFEKMGTEGEAKEIYFIDENNFEQFKEILSSIFCLRRHKKDEQNYNPANERARKIAEKLQKGREKVAAVRGPQKISVLSRYISILTVGEGKNMNELLSLTVYQLFDEFERFELKQAFDTYLKAKLASAQNIEEVENWMKELHSES